MFAADIFDRMLADANERQLLAYSFVVSVTRQDIASKLETAAVQGGLGLS